MYVTVCIIFSFKQWRLSLNLINNIIPFLQRFVYNLEKKKPDEVFCQEDTMREIFENYVEFRDKSNEINELLCDDDGKKFITDIYDSFELEKFRKIVCTTIDWRSIVF